MRLGWVIAAMLASSGCGRIGFDPTADPPPTGGPPGRIPNPSGIAGDLFGHQVAMSAAGDTIVLAARGADGVEVDTGAAYVFVPDGADWVLQATLVALVTEAGDQLGVSVAISGDGDTIALGETNDNSGTTEPTDNSAPQSGAVLVFARAGTTWSLQNYVKASVITAGDNFGSCVALSSDGGRLAVGARNENTGAATSGSGYIFVRAGTQYAFDAQIKSTSPNAGETLAAACALSDDGATFAASIPGATGNLGGAIVFHDDGTWIEQARLSPAGAVAGDSVGDGLALSGTGDTLVLGSGNHNGSAGALYVFDRAGTAWTEHETLVAANAQPDDTLGFNVAVADNGNAILAGAERADRGAVDTGGAYAFVRGAASSAGEIPVPAATADLFFGDCAAASADGTVFVVGALGDDGGRGAAYVFRDLRAYAP